MLCLKCGKKTEKQQVFCAVCLEDMERSPVKPGTAVLLPNRQESPAKKAPAKKVLSLKEQNRRLKRRVRWLALGLICSLLVLCFTAITLVQLTREVQTQPQNIGQNYSAIATKGN